MTDAAIPAATLVVWRDRGPAPEILVVERSARMAFAAGAIVFPGGRVDEADHELAAALGRPDEAARITAIRETIEETGVAPALRGTVSPGLGLELQQSLHEGGLPLAQPVEQRDGRLVLGPSPPLRPAG